MQQISKPNRLALKQLIYFPYPKIYICICLRKFNILLLFVVWIEAHGMTNSISYQEEAKTGGRIWLNSLEVPTFPLALCQLTTGTKWSKNVNQSLQQGLEQGFALPVWGQGNYMLNFKVMT